MDPLCVERLRVERTLCTSAHSSGRRAGRAVFACSLLNDRLTAVNTLCVALLPCVVPVLQSTVPLTLLDLPGNVAILSRSPPDTAAGNATLATYRCAASHMLVGILCSQASTYMFDARVSTTAGARLSTRRMAATCDNVTTICGTPLLLVTRFSSNCSAHLSLVTLLSQLQHIFQPTCTCAGAMLPCRCQESTNRLSIKFTAREGNPGRVTAYTIPALPPKTCSIIEVQLPPLCMHQMVSSIPGAAADAAAEGQQAAAGAANAPLLRKLAQSRPCSELVLQGGWGRQLVAPHCAPAACHTSQ